MSVPRSPNTITEVTRREIIDFLSLGRYWWHGCLDEAGFLSRIFDLGSLPSTESRFKNAADEIFHHLQDINHGDFKDSWVFDYPPFDILHGPDERFLRFLCQTVQPVVRPKSDEAAEMVRFYNEQLKLDSWEIVEETRISNRPVYAAQRIRMDADVPDRAPSRAEPGTPTLKPALKPDQSSESCGKVLDTLDFASEAGRSNAITAYSKKWSTDTWTCSQASLARTANVHPADLSKWKKDLLPVGSDKKKRLEEALKNNTPPTPSAKQRSQV